jgi:hypothetical protein
MENPMRIPRIATITLMATALAASLAVASTPIAAEAADKPVYTLDDCKRNYAEEGTSAPNYVEFRAVHMSILGSAADNWASNVYDKPFLKLDSSGKQTSATQRSNLVLGRLSHVNTASTSGTNAWASIYGLTVIGGSQGTKDLDWLKSKMSGYDGYQSTKYSQAVIWNSSAWQANEKTTYSFSTYMDIDTNKKSTSASGHQSTAYGFVKVRLEHLTGNKADGRKINVIEYHLQPVNASAAASVAADQLAVQHAQWQQIVNLVKTFTDPTLLLGSHAWHDSVTVGNAPVGMSTKFEQVAAASGMCSVREQADGKTNPYVGTTWGPTMGDATDTYLTNPDSKKQSTLHGAFDGGSARIVDSALLFGNFHAMAYRLLPGTGSEHHMIAMNLQLGDAKAVLPAPTFTPTVTGAAIVGNTLGVSGIPSGFKAEYQWLRDDKVIPDATKSTYKVVEADAGTMVSVKVTITKSGYASRSATSGKWSVSSEVALKTFEKSPVPTISGTAKFGSTLTADPGTWSPAIVPAFQWFRNGVAIKGANSSTYTLELADVARVIKVQVTGSATGYKTLVKESAATEKVLRATFTESPAPTISGTAKVGSKLTAKVGTWSPKITPAYQWYRNSALIKGATSSSYTLVAADLNKTITVKVTGTASGYETLVKASGATAKVARGTFTKTPTPTISGTLKVGQKLTVSTGTWSPKADALKIQWYASGKAISGATSKTFKLTSKQKGKTITVKVTGSKAGYTTVTKTSAKSKKVAA